MIFSKGPIEVSMISFPSQNSERKSPVSRYLERHSHFVLFFDLRRFCWCFRGRIVGQLSRNGGYSVTGYLFHEAVVPKISYRVCVMLNDLEWSSRLALKLMSARDVSRVRFPSYLISCWNLLSAFFGFRRVLLSDGFPNSHAVGRSR